MRPQRPPKRLVSGGAHEVANAISSKERRKRTPARLCGGQRSGDGGDQEFVRTGLPANATTFIDDLLEASWGIRLSCRDPAADER